MTVTARGGALAVIGHVERAWCHSFVWNGAADLEMFQSALFDLLGGKRVGRNHMPAGSAGSQSDIHPLRFSPPHFTT